MDQRLHLLRRIGPCLFFGSSSRASTSSGGLRPHPRLKRQRLLELLSQPLRHREATATSATRRRKKTRTATRMQKIRTRSEAQRMRQKMRRSALERRQKSQRKPRRKRKKRNVRRRNKRRWSCRRKGKENLNFRS